MCRPDPDYLARLHPERLDISDAYIVSGRSPSIWTHNFFHHAEQIPAKFSECWADTY